MDFPHSLPFPLDFLSLTVTSSLRRTPQLRLLGLAHPLSPASATCKAPQPPSLSPTTITVSIIDSDFGIFFHLIYIIDYDLDIFLCMLMNHMAGRDTRGRGRGPSRGSSSSIGRGDPHFDESTFVAATDEGLD
ncbi:hypothetical protein L6452_30149 [Arctium lappa]|uniref:Uncharacterized protein n=1 Tax=Arctium lappa TaxID=4217 RepID=A0ACB8ZID1_ARCLA|nr:hypothetical protein L6452_30149 [Arctium lappa]